MIFLKEWQKGRSIIAHHLTISDCIDRKNQLKMGIIKGFSSQKYHITIV